MDRVRNGRQRRWAVVLCTELALVGCGPRLNDFRPVVVVEARCQRRAPRLLVVRAQLLNDTPVRGVRVNGQAVPITPRGTRVVSFAFQTPPGRPGTFQVLVTDRQGRTSQRPLHLAGTAAPPCPPPA